MSALGTNNTNSNYAIATIGKATWLSTDGTPTSTKSFPMERYRSSSIRTGRNLLSHRRPEVQEALRDEYVHSEDGKSVFVPVGVMFVLLLQPYSPQLSMGGSGGGNDRGWRDLDDDEKDKYRFHVNFAPTHSKKPQVKRK